MQIRSNGLHWCIMVPPSVQGKARNTHAWHSAESVKAIQTSKARESENEKSRVRDREKQDAANKACGNHHLKT